MDTTVSTRASKRPRQGEGKPTTPSARYKNPTSNSDGSSGGEGADAAEAPSSVGGAVEKRLVAPAEVPSEEVGAIKGGEPSESDQASSVLSNGVTETGVELTQEESGAEDSPADEVEEPLSGSNERFKSHSSSSANSARAAMPGTTPGDRTCTSCRKSKVKCDKLTPCSRCVRLKMVCVAQTRGRGRPLSSTKANKKMAHSLGNVRPVEQPWKSEGAIMDGVVKQGGKDNPVRPPLDIDMARPTSLATDPQPGPRRAGYPDYPPRVGDRSDQTGGDRHLETHVGQHQSQPPIQLQTG
ncbi:unnamed protein product, partial [Discosporangium mesarthrocarpum]